MASNSTALATTGTKSVTALRDKFLSLKGRMAKLNEKAGETIEGVVTTLEIQASAFLFGAIQGAFYEPNPAKPNDKPGVAVFGIPVEALAGVGLIVGGFMGVGGSKWSTHMTHLGNGALAAWTSNLGRGWGFKFAAARKDGAKGTNAVKGEGNLRDDVAALLEGEDAE